MSVNKRWVISADDAETQHVGFTTHLEEHCGKKHDKNQTILSLVGVCKIYLGDGTVFMLDLPKKGQLENQNER